MPTHAETRGLPYSAEEMYDLVADVAQLSGIPALDGRRPHPLARRRCPTATGEVMEAIW